MRRLLIIGSFSLLGGSHVGSLSLSGGSHCQELFTVGELDVRSAQVHLLLSMEAEQSGMRYPSQCYLSYKLVTVRSSG